MATSFKSGALLYLRYEVNNYATGRIWGCSRRVPAGFAWGRRL